MKWLMEKKEPTGKFARWIMKIQSYNFTIEHRKGTQNQNADAISRIDYSRLENPNTLATRSISTTSSATSETAHTQQPLEPPTENNSSPLHTSNTSNKEESASVLVNSVPFDQQQEIIEISFENEAREADSSDVATLQRQCDDFKHIISYLESNILPEDKNLANLVTVVAENQYVLDDNVLHHIYTPRTKKSKEQNPDQLILQVALPTCKRETVLASYHDCKAGGGHFGIKRTFAAIKQKYWWPKMYQQIKDYITTCDVCQKTKISRSGHPAPLNPLPIEDVFSRIHIDILCSLPKTKEGYQYVLLVVDSFSKWTEAFPLKT